MQRLIKVDGKVRTDKNFPTGFMGKLWQGDENFTNTYYGCYEKLHLLQNKQ